MVPEQGDVEVQVLAPQRQDRVAHHQLMAGILADLVDRLAERLARVPEPRVVPQEAHRLLAGGQGVKDEANHGGRTVPPSRPAPGLR